MKPKLLILGVIASAALLGQRVTGSMEAELRGSGNSGEGKCTIEVEVDSVADVEIRGTRAVIRTISGGPSSFRRFQCNQAMPVNPGNFRFKGVDGRGNQSLVRPPGPGPAVVRIQDSEGGREGYTFDVQWNGGTDYGGYDDNTGFGRNRRGGGGNLGRGGYTDAPGWDNGGWGNGSGWLSDGTFQYSGGRRGAGSFVDRNGRALRLDAATVSIDDSGAVAVGFESEVGRIDFRGRVERREGRRVYAQVSGSGMYGLMELEMSSRNTVNRITMNDVRLNWVN